MKKNVSGQIIGVQLVNSADGTAFTGSASVSVTIDGGTQAAGGGTAPAHEGGGFHTYSPTQAETNGDHIGFTFSGSGAIPVTIQVYTEFPQTGDSFARIGAPSGVSISADIADIPTTSEFNARTLLSTDYFDPATDVVATVTNLTNLPTIPANWITAAGINASALNGKGDWNIGKTGYSLTQTFPVNFADMSITATTGQVSLLTATQASIDAIKADTADMQPKLGTPAVDISADIAALPTAAEVNAELVDVMETDTHAQPTAVPGATASYKDMFTYAFALNRNKITQTATTTLLRNDADTLTIGTSTVSDDATTFVRE